MSSSREPRYDGPNSLLEAALRYHARGWRVIPLHTPHGVGACSCSNSRCATPGKHPRVSGWRGALLSDEAQIRKWWRAWPDANVGILTGHAVNVLDVDPRHDGHQSRLTLRSRYGILPRTLTARSGSRGAHYVFRHPGAGIIIKSFANVGGLPGIDMRGEGGLFVAAPSLHERGTRYEWLIYEDEAEAIAPMPEWLIELTRQPDRVPLPSAAINGHARYDDDGRHWLDEALLRTSDGTGDSTGYWLAQQLLANHVSEFVSLLRIYAAQATVDPTQPFTGRDVQRWISSARNSDIVKHGSPARSQTARMIPMRPTVPSQAESMRAAQTSAPPAQWIEGTADSGATNALEEPLEPPGEHEDVSAQPQPRRRYPYTEMGNSERLVDQHGANMRYCKALGWCAWTGTHWKADADLTIQRWAKMTVRGIYAEAAALSAEAANCEDDEARQQTAAEADKLQEWARKSERAHMVAAMLSLARDACEIEPACFDANPWLFNCANGTIDLQTGQLRAHRRDDYLIKISPVAYDRDAEAQRFARFLEEIMLGRPHLVDYLQRIFGYSLTGEIREQEWYLLVGGGENGKSTLIELLADILGDYAGIQEPDSVTVAGSQRNAAAPSPDIAELKGKRLVAMTETEEGMRLATARIKRLTGGDKLKGRMLHHDLITFRPEFKLFMYTNHVPAARETTHAFWRRVRYIPFELDLKAHPERKDATLPAQLRTEAPGILRWLVDGCLGWQRDGMQTPAEVTAATDAYQNEQDTIAAFLSDCCDQSPERCATLPELYEAYKAWCEQGGERALTKRKFNLAIEGRGFDQTRTNTSRMWIGIGLSSTNMGGGATTSERR